MNAGTEAETTGRKQTVPETPIATTVTRISAPIEDVWRVLVAFDHYAQWHPVLSLDAKPEEVEEVIVGTKLPGRVTRAGAEENEVVLTIIELESPRRLAGEGGSLDALLGRHSFVLAPQPDGTTELTESEEFSGPAAAELIPALGRLTQDYARYSAALKTQAEALLG